MALMTGDEILEIATRLEENGEAFYASAADCATTAGVKALFRDLALQERLHRRAFEAMAGGEVTLGFTAEQHEEFLAYTDALLRKEFFDGSGGALDRAAHAGDERSVLKAALEFEKETLLFYHELEGIVGNADRETVAGIIQEEKQHIQRLSKMLAAV
ncbi:MAG: ferritin family protein [Anaerolineae bacterium]|nr:ferritin family protein [Anaerolineae bacterium]